ncbi:hypothetical protein LCGC14_2611520 [marine sediment metagenome]|uniref:Uncharacterized protein n=1 Tax=marine sediment metagenome TaxID=412755 RepID=A0A0F9A5Z4_9ZZZZ
MTDRIFAITVLLEEDIPEDEVESILRAIEMIKRGHTVEPHVANRELWAATHRARQELVQKLWEVLYPE